MSSFSSAAGHTPEIQALIQALPPWGMPEPLKGSAVDTCAEEHVEILKSGTAAAQEKAVTALKDLAKLTEGVKDLIREAGGMKLIVDFLRDCRNECKDDAATLLWNLASTSNQNRDAIREAGGVEVLVRLAHPGPLNGLNGQFEVTDEQKKIASMALWVLTINNTKNRDLVMSYEAWLEEGPLRALGLSCKSCASGSTEAVQSRAIYRQEGSAKQQK